MTLETGNPKDPRTLLLLEDIEHTELDPTDRAAAKPVADDVVDFAGRLLGREQYVILPIIPKGNHRTALIVIQPHETYRNTRLVIDVWHVPEGTNNPFDGYRSASYGFFGGRVINKPNLWLYHQGPPVDGKPTSLINEAGDEYGSPAYEVGEQELTDLLDSLYEADIES